MPRAADFSLVCFFMRDSHRAPDARERNEIYRKKRAGASPFFSRGK